MYVQSDYWTRFIEVEIIEKMIISWKGGYFFNYKLTYNNLFVAHCSASELIEIREEMFPQ